MKTTRESHMDFDRGELAWLGEALRAGVGEFVEEAELCGSVTLPLGIWWGFAERGLARFAARWLARARPVVAACPPVPLRWNLPPPPPPPPPPKRSEEPPAWDCSR